MDVGVPVDGELSSRSRLDRLASYVRRHLNESALEHGEVGDLRAYRWEHTLRVSHYGKQIAQAEGADLELVVAACLLHDVAHYHPGGYEDHGRLGARISRAVLLDLGYSRQQAENICYSVAVHVDGRADFEHPETLEAEVVSDADNVDRYGPYRLLRWCAGDLETYDSLISKLGERLRKLEEYRGRRVMGTETGHRLFNEQLDRQIAFFRALIEESGTTELPDLA